MTRSRMVESLIRGAVGVLALLLFACGSTAAARAVVAEAGEPDVVNGDSGGVVPDPIIALDGGDASQGDTALPHDSEAGEQAGWDGGDAEPEAGQGGKEAGWDGGDGWDAGAGPTCTPLGQTYAERPAECSCYASSSCQELDAGIYATGCVWLVTPVSQSGQGTCAGCTFFPPSTSSCSRCAETWNCGCFVAAGVVPRGARCCQSDAGPYFSEYACP
jgi:hypothetical protein